MEKDIFTDLKESTGCQYISDLRKIKKVTLMMALQKLPLEEYPAEQFKALLLYVLRD